MIAMARQYAPNAKVSLHASGWSTRISALYNTDPRFDVAAEARKVADFLLACGAGESDFVAVDVSDRDAGYYDTVGRDTWWDAANEVLPHYHQGFTWGRALAERVGRPILWWQLPVGNMALPNVLEQWQDNRVDYFFAHPDEVANALGFGMGFGAGADGQSTPSTDGGNLLIRTQAYALGGGQPPAP